MSAEEIRANNLPKLLKFCLAADDGSKKTATNPEELKEKAIWFQKFVQECSVNYGKKMLDDLQVLSVAIESKEVDDNVSFALEDLQDITENVDFAKDFIKMGGFEISRRLIEMDIGDVTIEGAQLIGNVTQNDVTCQTAAVNNGLVEFLLSRISSTSNGNHIKKLVFALSCCVRGSECGTKEFKLNNGSKIILKAMTAGQCEAKPKCAFLLFCTISDDEEIKINEVEYDSILKLVVQSSNLSQDGNEHLLGVLNICLKRDLIFRKLFTFEIKTKLQSFLVESAGKGECEDSVVHISEILKEL